MKQIIFACITALLSACTPHFVGDAPPIHTVSKAPDHFELPARFAYARIVYGEIEQAGAEEAALWKDVTDRAANVGSFAPLVTGEVRFRWRDEPTLIEKARNQRFNYLLVVRMHPSTGAADVNLYHTGSGGVMATAQTPSPVAGKNGFWGGEIHNPGKLERRTLKIAQATMPAVEELLRGVAERQR
ncbi:MAG: hypothetical protein ABJ251_16805 [Paracoccaceae bacterium]